MKYRLVVLGIFLNCLGTLLPGQTVAKPSEVFGNPISDEADKWLTDSNIKYNESMQRLQKQWIDGSTSYDADLAYGTILFEMPTRKVIFDVLIIGSVRKSDESWEWSWNNPNIRLGLRLPADKLIELGTKFDLRYLTHGMVPVPTKKFPFVLSGIALKLYGGVGVFCASNDQTDLFLLLSNPRVEPSA